MKRILCIVGSMDAGGAETFLMKLYRAVDTQQYQFDFCVSVEREGFYDNEIIKRGGRIYHVIPKSKNPIKAFYMVYRCVKENNYKSVLRVSQHSLSALELLAAKFGGAKILAFRSSNTNTGGSVISQKLHKVFQFLPIRIANVKIAPSKVAAKFMFGKNYYKDSQVHIIKNALNLDLYRYKIKNRIKKRSELGIGNKFVVGHIGRFTEQKNHEFLLEIFAELSRTRDDSILILIGKGELENIFRNKVKELGLTDKVLFLGVKKDIQDFLMAMDILVLPSLYEGMPNVVIEAQATGLPCLVSDKITNEVRITKLVNQIPLIRKLWLDELTVFRKKDEREKYELILKNKGYDISEVSKIFVNLVFNYS